MASGALPPGFPAVEIDGEYYWDGGLVSNTPLQWVVEAGPATGHAGLPGRSVERARRRFRATWPTWRRGRRKSSIRAAPAPTRTASRSCSASRTRSPSCCAKLPPELADSPEVAAACAVHADRKVYNLVQLIYRSKDYEGDSKDYEFSRLSMEEHWRAGYHDAVRTLRHPEVLERPTQPGRRLHLRSRRARPRIGRGTHIEPMKEKSRSASAPLRCRSPARPIRPGPTASSDREYLIITYRTDPEKLRALVPEPLEVDEPLVKYEFIRMPEFDRLRRLHRERPGDPGVASTAARAATRTACS